MTCWFLPQASPGGGGNVGTHTTISVRRSLAVGDSLAATAVADALIAQGYTVEFQTHPSNVALLRRHPHLSKVKVAPKGNCHVDLDGSYERHHSRKTRHFQDIFFETANEQLKKLGISIGPARNCSPKLVVRDNEREAVAQSIHQSEKPWVFICPRSNHYAVRQVPDGIWQAAAAKIQGSKFWLGTHPAPEGIVDLKVKSLDDVTVWLSVADLLVTVDTGPMHIGAALNVPLVVIGQAFNPLLRLSDQMDFTTFSPPLDCLGCGENVCPINATLPPCQQIDPEGLATEVNRKLRCVTTEDVSAIVAIYQPNVATLNKCLTSAVDQVSEIIVTAEKNSIIPTGALKHPKICYVQSDKAKIGYGRNANFGARHSCGKYLLLLNDDVFLNPGAVDSLLKTMKPDTGMVSHLLRYPDGKIYHAGVHRNIGAKDWHHIDHGKFLGTFKDVTELENCCGTSVLVRREAYYEIGGFDEEYFLYAEDADFAMRIRRAGWKILYTPHVEGIHMGHQSSGKVGPVGDLVAKSNALFHSKWQPYIAHNIGRAMGNFDYLKA